MPEEYPKDCAGRSISKDEEAALVKRLYDNQIELSKMREQQRQETLERQRKEHTKVISKSNEDALVTRMYDNQIELKKQREATNENKEAQEVHANDKKIDSEAMDNRIRHLYEETLQKKELNAKELEKRYMPEQEPKKMSQSEISESVARLYKVDWEERDRKLFEKWVYPNDPKMGRISRNKEKEMADRLSSKE